MRIKYDERFLVSLIVMGACSMAAIPCFAQSKLAQTQPSNKGAVLIADKAIQDAISSLQEVTTESEFKAVLKNLRQIGGTNYSDLIPQLLYRSINARGMKDTVFVGGIIEQLGIRDTNLVHALWPY